MNANRIPTWALAARMVFSLQCSSAASERVFSLVKNLFGADQVRVLADQDTRCRVPRCLTTTSAP